MFLVTDIKSTGAPHTNIATMPNAPFLYGVSIGVCMSSATSEPGGAGLGTVGWHEVRRVQLVGNQSNSNSYSKEFQWEARGGGGLGTVGWHEVSVFRRGLDHVTAPLRYCC